MPEDEDVSSSSPAWLDEVSSSSFALPCSLIRLAPTARLRRHHLLKLAAAYNASAKRAEVAAAPAPAPAAAPRSQEEVLEVAVGAAAFSVGTGCCFSNLLLSLKAASWRKREEWLSQSLESFCVSN